MKKFKANKNPYGAITTVCLFFLAFAVQADCRDTGPKLVLPAIKEHVSRKQNQTIFNGDCARCHAAPAQGKTGEPLFEAVCAMCHGHYGLGGTAPRINDLKFLETHGDAYIKKIITEGKEGTSMQGFSKERGGPLDEGQLDSLAVLIRWWTEGFVFKANEERHKHMNHAR